MIIIVFCDNPYFRLQPGPSAGDHATPSTQPGPPPTPCTSISTRKAGSGLFDLTSCRIQFTIVITCQRPINKDFDHSGWQNRMIGKIIPQIKGPWAQGPWGRAHGPRAHGARPGPRAPDRGGRAEGGARPIGPWALYLGVLFSLYIPLCGPIIPLCGPIHSRQGQNSQAQRRRRPCQPCLGCHSPGRWGRARTQLGKDHTVSWTK